MLFLLLLLLVKRKWQTQKEEKETEKQEKYCRGNFGMSGSVRVWLSLRAAEDTLFF